MVILKAKNLPPSKQASGSILNIIPGADKLKKVSESWKLKQQQLRSLFQRFVSSNIKITNLEPFNLFVLLTFIDCNFFLRLLCILYILF